jgi:hypothetical protein
LTGVALGAGDVYRLLIAILKNICNFWVHMQEAYWWSRFFVIAVLPSSRSIVCVTYTYTYKNTRLNTSHFISMLFTDCNSCSRHTTNVNEINYKNHDIVKRAAVQLLCLRHAKTVQFVRLVLLFETLCWSLAPSLYLWGGHFLCSCLFFNLDLALYIHVCMYLSVYVCVYVLICVCMYVCMYVCVCLCLCVCNCERV